MNFFPMLLNLEYKTAVVVGGGHVATQKVEALLPAKARIIVVSPDVTEVLQGYIERGDILWKNKAFEPSDLDDAAIVFAATNQPSVNDAVEEATQHWQLLSRADAAGRVDFINPAVVRRGEFVVTVSTSGNNPAFTRQVKDELSATYGEHYGVYVAFLGRARGQILEKFNGPKKREHLAELMNPRLLEWVEQGQVEKCEQWLKQQLGE